MAGNGPEGRVVDRRGVWWTGRASGRLEMSYEFFNLLKTRSLSTQAIWYFVIDSSFLSAGKYLNCK
jgi:hypothetical protein